MNVVILAGGMGTRLAEETEVRPKPMVEIGGRPILWHIMKHYAHYGHRDFLVALGYKGEIVKRFFLDYYTLNGSLTVRMGSGKIDYHRRECEDWSVNLSETGLETNTGGRLLRLMPSLGTSTFMLTYGDGVSSIDLDALLRFHKATKKIATVTAVRPPARFGALVLEGPRVQRFTEKPQAGEGWINGGYLVFEPDVARYLKDDRTSLEKDTLERLAADGELAAYRHEGFWQCVDTMRDLRQLRDSWDSGNPPWKLWP